MRSQLSLHKYICLNENLGNLGCLQTQCGGSSASLGGNPIPQGPTWDAGSQSEPHVRDRLWPRLSSG